MEWKEALPLLQENHTGVAISVTPKGRAQATVVSTAVLDGKVGFASRGYTVKVKNIQRTGRATLTVIKLDTLAAQAALATGVRKSVCLEYLSGLDYGLSYQHLAGLTEFFRRLVVAGKVPNGSLAFLPAA